MYISDLPQNVCPEKSVLFANYVIGIYGFRANSKEHFCNFVKDQIQLCQLCTRQMIGHWLPSEDGNCVTKLYIMLY